MRLLIFFVLILIMSCKNDKNYKEEKDIEKSGSETLSSDISISFDETDSLEFYIYSNPQNTKKFSRLFVRESAIIDQLINNLSADTISIKECEHDGKIYLYNNGEVFKTIYISTNDSCNYLAYALNGQQRFFKITHEVNAALQQLKKKANF